MRVSLKLKAVCILLSGHEAVRVHDAVELSSLTYDSEVAEVPKSESERAYKLRDEPAVQLVHKRLDMSRRRMHLEEVSCRPLVILSQK